MPQEIFRIRSDIHLGLVGFLLAVRAEDRSLEMIEPLNFIFELRFHTQFIDIDLVKYFQQLSD